MPGVLLSAYLAVMAAGAAWFSLFAPEMSLADRVMIPRTEIKLPISDEAIAIAKAQAAKDAEDAKSAANKSNMLDNKTALPAGRGPALVPSPPKNTPTTTPPPYRLNLPPVEATPSLTPAPVQALVKQTPFGLLPVTAPDGRASWRIYAHPFTNTGKQGRIATVLHGMGLDRNLTDTVIKRLPGTISLIFPSTAPNLTQWVKKARAAGHEVLITIPTEPEKAKRIDPGPNALMTGLEPPQNIKRLERLLAVTTGYIGITSSRESSFITIRRHVEPVLVALRDRSLMYFDISSNSVIAKVASEIGLPWSVSQTVIDTKPGYEAITAILSNLEKQAQKLGSAIAVGNAYPVTVEALGQWIAGLGASKVVFVPVSNLTSAVEPARSP